MKKIEEILIRERETINLDEEVLKNIKDVSKNFCSELRKKIKNKKIKSDILIGGSIAKNTLVKREDGKYDVDIFVRFEKKYKTSEISKLLGKILGKKVKKVHGSRDYYQRVINDIIIEIIPVMKIKSPKQAENVTDLSYFHVKYIVRKIKRNKKLAEEIKLAKTFCYSQNCYGAESYIHGFSGYGLELLICHYGSFLKFIKEMVKVRKEKIIIDDGKFFKNKKDILIEINESKLISPIILIDPTFKERNALASLSNETFEKFKESCRNFLKNPSIDFFIKKDIKKEFGDIKDLKTVRVKTSKQKGDIAGTKSKKFFKFFSSQLKRDFSVKRKEFDYDENKNLSYFYFILGKKGKEIIKGPHITKAENLAKFKRFHKKAFIKNHFAYAEITHNKSFEQWLKYFKKKYKKIIKEMCIKKIKI